MTQLNGELAIHTDGITASWIVHGIGTLVALMLMFGLAALGQKEQLQVTSKAPLWSYSGGVFGALAIVLYGVTLAAGLPLAAALALSLSGQVVVSLVLDQIGFLGLPSRKLTLKDLTSAALILSGSLLIVFFGV